LTRLTAAPALLSAVGGVGLYYLGGDNLGLAAVAVGVVLLAGYALLRVGRDALRRRPVLGVWLMNGWILGIVAVGAAIAAGLIVLGIEVTDALSKSPESEASEVGGLITGAVATFAGTLFTKDLEEGSGDIWPAAKTKQAMASEFTDKFDPRTQAAAYQAVFEERVRGHPKARGWGLEARHRRAKLSAAEL
jgi:hypothetical protein